MEQVVLISMQESDLRQLIKDVVRDVIDESKNSEKKEVLSSNELIEWLGISLSTLNKWKREHYIPYKRLGKRIFFKKDEVLKALKESNYSKIKELGA